MSEGAIPTPRVDEAAHCPASWMDPLAQAEDEQYVEADFARALERECTAKDATIARLRGALRCWKDGLRVIRDDLEAARCTTHDPLRRMDFVGSAMSSLNTRERIADSAEKET